MFRVVPSYCDRVGAARQARGRLWPLAGTGQRLAAGHCQPARDRACMDSVSRGARMTEILVRFTICKISRKGGHGRYVLSNKDMVGL